MTKPDLTTAARIKELAAWIARMEASGQDKTRPGIYADLLSRLKRLSIDKKRRQ